MTKFPGWVEDGGEWWLHLTEQDATAGCVSFVGNIYQDSWAAWASIRPHAAEIDSGRVGGPEAADACEAALRAAGVLAPDAVVWRPPELRAPVWLASEDDVIAVLHDTEADARETASRVGVRLLRAVEVES